MSDANHIGLRPGEVVNWLYWPPSGYNPIIYQVRVVNLHPNRVRICVIKRDGTDGLTKIVKYKSLSRVKAETR